MISRCICAAVCAAYSFAFASAACAAPPAVPVEQTLEFKSFTASVSGPIPLGTEILVTLVGTPGGKAIFGIPNVIDHAPMPETAPGVYLGRYTVGTGHDVIGDRIVGRLILPGGLQSPMLCAPNAISIDTTKPKLVDLFPADGDVVACSRPVLYCGFDDGAGTGIDPRSVQVEVDGREVAAVASIGPNGVSYQPPLSLSIGPHIFFVAAADGAGNRAWLRSRFDIAAPSPSSIVSVQCNGPASPTAGAPLSVTVVGAPGGRAELSVPPLEGTVALSEIEPGRYTGKFGAHGGIGSVTAAPCIIRFTTRDGQRFAATLSHPLTVASRRPLPPTVRYPGDLYSFQGGIEMGGTAPANDRVVCTVTYDSRSAGGVMPFSGNAMTAVARVDAAGKWKMGPFDLRLGLLYAGQRDTRLSVTAVTIDESGAKSDPVVVPVDFSP